MPLLISAFVNYTLVTSLSSGVQMMLFTLLFSIAGGSKCLRLSQYGHQRAIVSNREWRNCQNTTLSDVAKKLIRTIEHKEAIMTSDDEYSWKPTFAWGDEGNFMSHHADNWRVKHIPMGALVDFLEKMKQRYDEEASTGKYAKKVRSDDGGHSVIIGDIHGQLFVMLPLLEDIRNRHPDYALLPGSELLICDKRLHYVFLGDFVDRGAHGIEVATLALAYKALCPYVTLLKGNHELENINDMYGFTDEVVRFEQASAFATKLSNPSLADLKKEYQEGLRSLQMQQQLLRSNQTLIQKFGKFQQKLISAARELEGLLGSVERLDQLKTDVKPERVRLHGEGGSLDDLAQTVKPSFEDPTGSLKPSDLTSSVRSSLAKRSQNAVIDLDLLTTVRPEKIATLNTKENISMDLDHENREREAELAVARSNQVQQFRSLLLDVLSIPPHREKSKLYTRFLDIFDRLPLVAVVEDMALAMHAGLQKDLVELCSEEDFESCLTKAANFPAVPSKLPKPIEGVLWSDPDRDPRSTGFSPNVGRGAGDKFAPLATYTFLKKKGLKWLVRAHEAKREGFEEIFYEEGKAPHIRETAPADVYPDNSISIFTIFSAADYCGFLEKPGPMGNSASYLIVKPTGAPVVHKLTPDNARMMMSSMGKSSHQSFRALQDAMQEASVEQILHYYEAVLRVKSLKEFYYTTTKADIEMEDVSHSNQSQAFEKTVRETLKAALVAGAENGGMTREEILTMEATKMIEETGEAPVTANQLVSYTLMDYSIVRVFDELGGKPEDKQQLLLSIARRKGVQLHVPQISTPASYSDTDELVQKPPHKVVYIMAFRYIDTNNDGKVSAGELKQAMLSTNENVAEVNAVVDAAFLTKEESEGMAVEEFIHVMQGIP